MASKKIKGTAVKYAGTEDYRTIEDVSWGPGQIIILDEEVADYLLQVAGDDFVIAPDDEASESLLELAEASEQGELDLDGITSDASTESGTDA